MQCNPHSWPSKRLTASITDERIAMESSMCTQPAKGRLVSGPILGEHSRLEPADPQGQTDSINTIQVLPWQALGNKGLTFPSHPLRWDSAKACRRRQHFQLSFMARVPVVHSKHPDAYPSRPSHGKAALNFAHACLHECMGPHY